MRVRINLLSVLQWTFFIVAGLLFVGSVFFNISTAFWFSFAGQMTNFLIFTALFCLLACAAYYVSKNRVLDFLQKRYLAVVYGTMSVIFVFQLYFTWLIQSPLLHDVSTIIVHAQASSPYDFYWIEYFSLYPNNFLVLFFFRFLHSRPRL